MFKKKAFPAEKTLQMLRFTQHDNVLRLPSFGKPQYDTALSFCAGVALLCSPHVILNEVRNLVSLPPWGEGGLTARLRRMRGKFIKAPHHRYAELLPWEKPFKILLQASV